MIAVEFYATGRVNGRLKMSIIAGIFTREVIFVRKLGKICWNAAG